MELQEIGKINDIFTELSDFQYTEANQTKVESIKSELKKIIEHSLKNDLLLEKINKITFKPKLPYFPEMAEIVRKESWQKDVLELRQLSSILIDELQQNIIVNSQKDIKQIIAKGLENKSFEFKSSLRWDLKESKINKDLEQVIIKSVASFSNANGGNLLIGVEDNGNVLGLELDCKTLKNGAGNLDDFELHLRNLLEKTFGIGFTTNQLNIEFPQINIEEVEVKEICHIKIFQGEKPMFIDKIDKNGVKREVFYIRSGNSSKEIEKMSEFFDYAKTRFYI